MDTSKKYILQYLDSRRIPYDMVVHDPVYTMEEGAALHLPHQHQVAKNLFLCDDKRTHYYMVVLEQNRQLDLKQLRTRLASRRLTFSPECDLQDMLCLQKGSVTPFGVLNDLRGIVEVLIDRVFQGEWIGVHPNDNAATLFLDTEVLISMLKLHGSKVQWLDL